MAVASRDRFWRWRVNPLRRRSDVVEAWVLLCTAVVMTLGGVVTAALTYFSVQESIGEQRAQRERVSAVLTEDARSDEPRPLYAPPNEGESTVTVRWTGPDGQQRQGTMRVAEGMQAGSTVQMWIDEQGRQVGEPPGVVMTTFQAVLCAGLATGSLVVLTLGLRRGACGLLDRRRSAQWERAWAEVEPHWRPRTP